MKTRKKTNLKGWTEKCAGYVVMALLAVLAVTTASVVGLAAGDFVNHLTVSNITLK